MGELRPWHIIVLVVVVFVLFGYKKLPDATRSLGRSLRILKTEVKSLHEDDEKKDVEVKVEAAPRAVEAPRPAVPEVEAAKDPAPPVAAGAPSAPGAESDKR